MPTAHILHGFLGSGKTTLAKSLEREFSAVRFTPDEWMARLFGADPPAESFPDNVEIILELMASIWLRCLELGLDVVLDYGLWSRCERDLLRERIAASGSQSRLYRLDCPLDEAWLRIAARNASSERSLYISRSTFDQLRARFEPLEADEVHVEV